MSPTQGLGHLAHEATRGRVTSSDVARGGPAASSPSQPEADSSTTTDVQIDAVDSHTPSANLKAAHKSHLSTGHFRNLPVVAKPDQQQAIEPAPGAKLNIPASMPRPVATKKGVLGACKAAFNRLIAYFKPTKAQVAAVPQPFVAERPLNTYKALCADSRLMGRFEDQCRKEFALDQFLTWKASEEFLCGDKKDLDSFKPVIDACHYDQTTDEFNYSAVAVNVAQALQDKVRAAAKWEQPSSAALAEKGSTALENRPSFEPEKALEIATSLRHETSGMLFSGPLRRAGISDEDLRIAEQSVDRLRDEAEDPLSRTRM